MAIVWLAVIIMLLNTGAVQAADDATDLQSLPLREQVRIMTGESGAGAFGGDTAGADGGYGDAGRNIDQGIDAGQSAWPGNLPFGSGYERRMGAQPGRRGQ